MPHLSLEERVAILEQQVRRLMLANRTTIAPKGDWRDTVGMFTGDEYMTQIDAAALEIREKDRRRSRRRSAKKKPRRSKS